MSAGPRIFAEKALALELSERGGDVVLAWRGRSEEREPSRFLVPVLQEALEAARAGGRRLVLDFTALDYMNSSTFAPLVKLLELARRTGVAVQVRYSLAVKWQSLSFTALRAFETPDGRISVHGE